MRQGLVRFCAALTNPGEELVGPPLQLGRQQGVVLALMEKQDIKIPHRTRERLEEAQVRFHPVRFPAGQHGSGQRHRGAQSPKRDAVVVQKLRVPVGKDSGRVLCEHPGEVTHDGPHGLRAGPLGVQREIHPRGVETGHTVAGVCQKRRWEAVRAVVYPN